MIKYENINNKIEYDIAMRYTDLMYFEYESLYANLHRYEL